ncbi:MULTISPECIES: LmeA family phospholipid-binding protein [unclassified Nocardia]|uniref:LmeA family phospholipid-binding protein n=1 Tax=unclassified Nocardia TaxID=2637762 RepID=UPI0033B38194
MRAVLILIVVGVIGLVVGDRVAVVLAQNEIGRAIAAEYDLAQPPDVEIGGVPFLTQAIDGIYRDIDIRVGDWSGENISVRDLDVVLTDVSAPLTDIVGNRTANLVAATATATAVVPYDVVRTFAPSGVESISDSPEGLRVTGTFPVAGLSVPATVFVTVAPTDAGIEVTPVSVQSALGGPTVPLSLLRGPLTFVVPLQELPLGARLTAIRPAPDGLHATAVAHDVHFTDLP